MMKKKTAAGIDFMSNIEQVVFLWFLMDNTTFAAQKLRELELAQFGITVEQSSILHLLQERSSMTIKELCDFTMRQLHTTYSIINRMIKMGLVKKIKNPEDKGAKFSITKSGKILLNKLKTDSLEMVFSTLSIEERQWLANCLNALLSKSRELLETSFRPAFLQYLNSAVSTDMLLYKKDTHEEPRYYQLWTLLIRTEFAVARLRELELAQFGVTLEQSMMLYLLKEHAQLTNKELRDLTMRQHNSIYILTNRMIKIGLIKKMKNLDNNTSRLCLTHAGENMINTLKTDSLDITFSVLTIKERKQLATCLNSVFNKTRELLEISSRPTFFNVLLAKTNKSS